MYIYIYIYIYTYIHMCIKCDFDVKQGFFQNSFRNVCEYANAALLD